MARIGFLGALIFQFSKATTGFYAVVYGMGVFLTLRTALEKYMLFTHDCEKMAPFDEIYFYDTEKHMCNYVGTTFFKPFEFESMRDYIFAKTENIHKSRSKVEKKYG